MRLSALRAPFSAFARAAAGARRLAARAAGPMRRPWVTAVLGAAAAILILIIAIVMVCEYSSGLIRKAIQ